jgi:hypothetical protein
MMDPKMYIREAERYEREQAQRERVEKSRPHPSSEIRVPVMSEIYSREQLSSGCILYRLGSGKRPARSVVRAAPVADAPL